MGSREAVNGCYDLSLHLLHHGMKGRRGLPKSPTFAEAISQRTAADLALI